MFDCYSVAIETGEVYTIASERVSAFCENIRNLGYAIVSVTPLV